MSEVGRIRSLERGDLAELEELCREHAAYERSAWPEYPRQEGFEALFLGNERAWCWVVEGDGELAGFASVAVQISTWDARHYLYLDCLYLRPAYRSRGWGRSLMAKAAATALRESAANLQWQTPAWNEGAVRFYDRLGATRTEKQRFTLSPQACADLLAKDS